MSRRSRISLSSEGWYYLLVLLFIITGAMLRDINLLVVLAGMMVGPMLLSVGLSAMVLRKLKPRRLLPNGICAGDLLVTEIECHNPRRRSAAWAVTIEDSLARADAVAAPAATKNSDNESVHPEVIFPYVAAGQTKSVAYRARIARRGVVRFGPLRVSTRFPLGLLKRTLEIEAPATLVVCPRLGRLDGQWLARLRRDRAGTQGSLRQVGLREGDFHGLRDWRPGDNRRWIHWRTSARRDKLAIRQFEQQREEDLAIVLDLWSQRAHLSEEDAAVETAVSLAASMATQLCQRGGCRLLVSSAGTTPLRGAASSALLREIMERLASVRSEAGDSLPARLDEAMGIIRPGGSILVVSTRPADLADTERFAQIWTQPRRRQSLRQVRVLDVHDAEVMKMFQLDEHV